MGAKFGAQNVWRLFFSVFLTRTIKMGYQLIFVAFHKRTMAFQVITALRVTSFLLPTLYLSLSRWVTSERAFQPFSFFFAVSGPRKDFMTKRESESERESARERETECARERKRVKVFVHFPPTILRA